MTKSSSVLLMLIMVLTGAFFMAPAAFGTETLDQSNNPAWTGGAVNIAPANSVSQTFVPSLPVLTSVEVELKTGNKGRGGDQVTLKILNSSGQQLASVTALINEGFEGFRKFTMPGNGINVTPGQPLTIRLQDTGKIVFWWKYKDGNTYAAGKAIFHGAPFNDNDFFFKTYGKQPAPTFSLAVVPDPVNINKGGSKQITVNVTRQNGFNGSVLVSFPTLLSGVSANPATKTISTSSATFTLSASTAAKEGKYIATVKGVSGSIQPFARSFQIKILSAASQCAQGQTYCNGKCVDTKTDSANCGSCGKVCSSNQKCSAGVCVTQTPLCGGQTCGAGQYCCQNACRQSGVGSCPYQGSSAEYYCPKDTVTCPQNIGDPLNKCCCGVYDGKIRSCPGSGK